MPYADPNTVHNPATGTVAPAAWGDVLRDDLEFLIDPPACSVKASSAQSVTNNTFTALTAGTENYDNDAMHSTVTNTSRITAQTAGRYLFIAAVSFASNATGRRAAWFKLNNTTDFFSTTVPAVNGNPTDIAIARTLTLAASDYVEVFCVQDSGGNLNVTLYEFAAMFMTR